MRPFTLESPANVAHITATCESISSQDDTSSDVMELDAESVASGAPRIVAALRTARRAERTAGAATRAAAAVEAARADIANCEARRGSLCRDERKRLSRIS
jgi:hypothetical protein